jgi:HSP20 family protein
MWRTFADLDSAFSLLDDVRRQLDGRLEEGHGFPRQNWNASPPFNVYDTGESFVLVGALPGLGTQDIDVSATTHGLTIRGERKTPTLEGYVAHRAERAPWKFSRSFRFPVRVDVERVGARFENGLLRVDLPKLPEAQPRTIAVQS